jgi:uncharacterized membrane protein
MHSIATLSIFVATLLAGGVFGFFYAWSVTVMRGLSAADGVSAIASMNAVNATIMTPWFAILFFGAPAAAAVAATLAWLGGDRGAALAMAAAAVIYLVGCFAVTVVVNVPMNDALAQVDPRATADPAAAWRDYAVPWTAWNHVRTAACGLAFLAALVGLWRWPA